MLRVKPTFEMLFSTAAGPNYRTRFRDLRQLQQSLKQSPTPQALEDYKKLLGQSKTLGNAYISGKRVLLKMLARMQEQVQQADPGWQSEDVPQETSLLTDDPIPETTAPATPMEPTPVRQQEPELEPVGAEPFRNTEQLTQPDIGQPDTGNLQQEIDDITKQWGAPPPGDPDQIRQELEQDMAGDDPFQQAVDQVNQPPAPSQFRDGPEAAKALHAAMQAFGKQMNESAIRPYNAVAPQLMEVARWARKGIDATPEQIQGTGSLIDMLNRGMEAQESVSAYMQAIAKSAEDALTLWGYSKGQSREDVAQDWVANQYMAASAGSAMKKLNAGSGMRKIVKGLSMNSSQQARLAKKIGQYKQAQNAYQEALEGAGAPGGGAALAQLTQQLERLMGEIGKMLQQAQTAAGTMNTAPGTTTPPTTPTAWTPQGPQQAVPPEQGKTKERVPWYGRNPEGYDEGTRNPGAAEWIGNAVGRGVKAPFRLLRDMGGGGAYSHVNQPVLTAAMGSASRLFLSP